MRSLRSLALLSCALAACTTHAFDPSYPPGNVEPTSSGQPDDRAADASPVDPRLSSTLARVEAAMQPVCGTRCGSATLVVTPGIESTAHTRVRIPGYSLIEIRQADLDRLLASDDAVLYWVIAHEYGHHLDITAGNANLDGDWGLELRAEALAGCALERAGLIIDPVLDLSRHSEAAAGRGAVLAEQFGSDGTHPHWRYMRHAILAGYAACADGARTVDEVAASVTTLTAQVVRDRSPLLRPADARGSQDGAVPDGAQKLAAPVQPLLP